MMDLNKALGKAQKPVKSVSEGVNLAEYMKAAQSQMKLIVFGESGVGKTSFALSVITHLKEKGKKPEEIMMVFLDNDAGLVPLLRKGIIDQEYWPSITYVPCKEFTDIRDNTDKYIPLLLEHQKKFGQDSAWLVVDNTQVEWEWVREHFALTAYGMTEHELALKKRQQALNEGKAMLPTFNQKFDYAVINPIHRDWADGVKTSGINFIWLTPESSWTEQGEDTPTIKPKGQGGDILRVDHAVRLYRELQGSTTNYYAQLWKSRTANKYFSKLLNPTYTRFLQAIEKVNAM